MPWKGSPFLQHFHESSSSFQLSKSALGFELPPFGPALQIYSECFHKGIVLLDEYSIFFYSVSVFELWDPSPLKTLRTVLFLGSWPVLCLKTTVPAHAHFF